MFSIIFLIKGGLYGMSQLFRADSSAAAGLKMSNIYIQLISTQVYSK